MPAGHDISADPDPFFRHSALAVDAPANATTTGVEIIGLRIPGVGPGTYIVEYFILYSSAATSTGVKFGMNHTGTVTSIVASLQWQESTTAASTGAASQAAAGGTLQGGGSARALSTTAPNLGPSISVDSAGGNMLACIDALLVVSVIGDLALWHASEVAFASTVKAGSICRLTKAA